MTPTEFDFIVTMPGDSRLLGAIRQLTSHAAGYAQLTEHAGEQLAAHVEHATQAVIAASTVPSALIEYRFSGDADALLVVFRCDVAPEPKHLAPVPNGDVTVDWSVEGSRHVCRIRQRLSA
jgi:hypothetical protein